MNLNDLISYLVRLNELEESDTDAPVIFAQGDNRFTISDIQLNVSDTEVFPLQINLK